MHFTLRLARCKFSGGDVIRGNEKKIGKKANSEEECAELVFNEESSATGATWEETTNNCWAEFGNEIKFSSSYRACLFPTSGNQ